MALLQEVYTLKFLYSGMSLPMVLWGLTPFYNASVLHPQAVIS
jgi:hypothetical protein